MNENVVEYFSNKMVRSFSPMHMGRLQAVKYPQKMKLAKVLRSAEAL